MDAESNVQPRVVGRHHQASAYRAINRTVSGMNHLNPGWPVRSNCVLVTPAIPLVVGLLFLRGSVMVVMAMPVVVDVVGVSFHTKTQPCQGHSGDATDDQSFGCHGLQIN